MGTRNKQRRADKARRRARQEGHRGGGRHRGPQVADRSDDRNDRARPATHRLTPAEVRRLIDVGATAPPDREVEYDAVAIPLLAAHEPGAVDEHFERSLAAIVEVLWRNGWQPAELVRHARRQDGRTGRLVAMAVAADTAARDPRTLHPRWSAQLDQLGLLSGVEASGWFTRFAHAEALGRAALLAATTAALRALHRVGPLNVVVPPPGSGAATTSTPTAAADDPVLRRVRALLTQAEATNFPAEAETFTVKAQELMARHAIDVAMVWASSARDERPASARLFIDDPYADIKSLLLQHVAEHSRCRAVYHPGYALSSVVGFASDVAATELLFTSLLVQAQAAMQAEAKAAGPGGRARSRSFRSSFLLAYTQRIDQRLREVNQTVTDAAVAEGRGALLPALVERDQAVTDAYEEMFESVRSSPVRGGYDGVGWGRGTLAAERARLTFGDLDAPDPGQ